MHALWGLLWIALSASLLWSWRQRGGGMRSEDFWASSHVLSRIAIALMAWVALSLWIMR